MIIKGNVGWSIIACFFWHNYLLKSFAISRKMKEEKNKSNDEYKYVEPPEFREAGVPPLLKQLKWLVLGITVILVIVLAIAIYFYYLN